MNRFLTLCISCICCLDAIAQVAIPSGNFMVETYANSPVIVCNILPEPASYPVETISLGGEEYTFATAQSSLSRGQFYEVSGNGTTYRLYFSIIPLVNIQVSDPINEDDEVYGTISVTDTVGGTFTSNIGIKWRGATSITYPKKSFRVQLKKDDDITKNRDASIFGLRSDKRWLMLALYNEKMRINNKVSHDLWMDLHKLYYADDEPEALSGIRSRYVLAFVNNRYRGIYLFTEDLDRKQYKLDKDEGELYKENNPGPPHQLQGDFSSIPPIPPAEEPSETWAEWEVKHPDNTTWSALHDFSVYVKNTDIPTLQENIWDLLVKDNVIDYILFCNLLKALDNWNKNLFLARYKQGEPYFYGVWDLDGTWGYHWFADRTPSASGFYLNHLFDKILAGNDPFKNRIMTRWFSLRHNLFQSDNLKNRLLTHYTYLTQNGVYPLEEIVRERNNAEGNTWDEGWLAYSQDEIDYCMDWVERRLDWMDDFFINSWNGGTLPVNLSDFRVRKEENSLYLTWQTSLEVNARRFDVSHSTNGVYWTVVGTIPAKGQSENSNIYTFAHETPSDGLNYYQLKIIDIDGSFEYSNILPARFEIPEQAEQHVSATKIYPNPVRDKLHIEVSYEGGVKEISLNTLSGNTLLVQKTPGNAAELDVSSYHGLYFLRIRFEDGTQEVKKVLIR